MLKAREAEHQRRLEDQAEELRKEAAHRRDAEEAERRMESHRNPVVHHHVSPKMPCEKPCCRKFLQ